MAYIDTNPSAGLTGTLPKEQKLTWKDSGETNLVTWMEKLMTTLIATVDSGWVASALIASA